MKHIAVGRFLFLGLGLAGVLYSCSNNTEIETPAKEQVFKGFHYSLDSVIRKKEGIFHGFELGSTAKEIKAYEYKKPEDDEPDYSVYSYKIDSISDYSIAYTFVKDSLDEVEIQINSRSLDAGNEILNSMKKYFSEKYTAPLMDKGIYVFNCFDSRKRNFKISLTDNSTSETAIINMLVYREK